MARLGTTIPYVCCKALSNYYTKSKLSTVCYAAQLRHGRIRVCNTGTCNAPIQYLKWHACNHRMTVILGGTLPPLQIIGGVGLWALAPYAPLPMPGYTQSLQLCSSHADPSLLLRLSNLH